VTDEQSPDDKSPVEQAFDLFVFAPLGLAMTARTQLPDMVAKGRAQVEGQITVARFLGQFAVQHGKAEVEKRLKAYTAPPEPAAQPAQPEAEAVVEPEPVAAPVAAPVTAPAGGEPGAEPSSARTVPVTVVAQPAPEQASPADPPPAGAAPPADVLAIHGYDALSASQVVQRLAGLSPAELEQVRAYEAATRGRKTVLTKISQLQ